MITGKIKDLKIDENGNIMVYTDYYDGEFLVQEGAARYTFRTAETLDEIKARIHQDVDEHCKALITRSHFRKRNIEGLEGLKQAVIGHTATHHTAESKKDDQTFLLEKTGKHQKA